MTRSIFLGDSFTSGENTGGTSFVDFVDTQPNLPSIVSSNINLGVSGSCFGEYSLYPVIEQSCLYQIRNNESIIKVAKNIFLEYGINDVSAMSVGYVTYEQVLIDFVKCLDYLKQLNPEANIYFLTVSRGPTVNTIAERQRIYLAEDYFKHITSFNFSHFNVLDRWVSVYRVLTRIISKHIPVLEMIPNIEVLLDNMDDDGIHPNLEGYKLIGQHISKQLSHIQKH